MSWSADKLQKAEIDTLGFFGEFETTYTAVKEKISTGAPDADVLAGYVAVSEVLRRWRAHSETLQNAVTDSNHIDGLQRKLVELADQREILARLESEAGTRTNQATSVNPKVTASPYTNILGLQRTFRSPVRTGLLIAGIVFAVIAVAALVFLGVRLVIAGGIPSTFVGMNGGGSAKVSRGGA
jgi:hypothetical protein